MNIAILGNGKMGKLISELATKKGHIIICISDSNKPAISLNLKNIDVAIDFSTPDTAFENISHAINSNIPVVSGTTGWLNKLEEIENLCISKRGTFLYSSNFSLGVNILFEINKKLAMLMKDHNYTSKIYETHHTDKLDKPSGTAITLGDNMFKILKDKTAIKSSRIAKTTGIHQVIYSSELDEIEIKHTANNRNGFANGAIMAAEWIKGRKGIYSMKDVLKN